MRLHHHRGGVLYIERRELPLAVVGVPGVGKHRRVCFLVRDPLFPVQDEYDGFVADVFLFWIHVVVLRGPVLAVWECGGGGGNALCPTDLFEFEGRLKVTAERGKEGGRETGRGKGRA